MEPGVGTQPAPAKYKIVFLGDQCVGKTSLINRFIYDSFDNTYQATIGIDFLSKSMFVDDKTVKLQLWDTAGQERFKSLIPSYIKDSLVAIVLYDITNRNSFKSVENWINDVKQARGNETIIILVGNKIDLADKRAVSTDEGQSLADSYSAMFFESSAKSGENVKTIFTKLAYNLPGLENVNPDSPQKPQHQPESKIKIGQPQAEQNEKKGSSCC